MSSNGDICLSTFLKWKFFLVVRPGSINAPWKLSIRIMMDTYVYIWNAESGSVQCKCGWNSAKRQDDLGEAGNWPLFPLVSLMLGDTGYSYEKMYFRIGPMICQQGKEINNVKSKICVSRFRFACQYSRCLIYCLSGYSYIFAYSVLFQPTVDCLISWMNTMLYITYRYSIIVKYIILKFEQRCVTEHM